MSLTKLSLEGNTLVIPGQEDLDIWFNKMLSQSHGFFYESVGISYDILGSVVMPIW